MHDLDKKAPEMTLEEARELVKKLEAQEDNEKPVGQKISIGLGIKSDEQVKLGG